MISAATPSPLSSKPTALAMRNGCMLMAATPTAIPALWTSSKPGIPAYWCVGHLPMEKPLVVYTLTMAGCLNSTLMVQPCGTVSTGNIRLIIRIGGIPFIVNLFPLPNLMMVVLLLLQESGQLIALVRILSYIG